MSSAGNTHCPTVTTIQLAKEASKGNIGLLQLFASKLIVIHLKRVIQQRYSEGTFKSLGEVDIELSGDPQGAWGRLWLCKLQSYNSLRFAWKSLSWLRSSKIPMPTTIGNLSLPKFPSPHWFQPTFGVRRYGCPPFSSLCPVHQTINCERRGRKKKEERNLSVLSEQR